MFLPAEIIQLYTAFAPAFTAPTYHKAWILVIGTILAQGNRTVTAALRVLRLDEGKSWAKYHHVLNRAQWSGLEVSAILLRFLVRTFVAERDVAFISVDETLERRWGPKIHKRGHWRDSLASGRNMNVSASGIRWLVFAIVVSPPWTPYEWSLPFLSIPLTTPKVSKKLGIRHRTVAQRTAQVIYWLRRTLPGQEIHLIGDGAYSVVRLGLRAQACGVILVAPLRLDARLFDHPPVTPGKRGRGRPPVVGQRLPTLENVATAASTLWHRGKLSWYGGHTEVVDWSTGTALWYTTGTSPLLIRWVLVRDPAGERPLRAYFTTDIYQPAPSIITDFVKRWSIEVTFEEVRAHLGLETQRQWSDKAIERTTPALLGLYSLIVLMAVSFFQDGRIPLPKAGWYKKSHASFHDILTSIRRHLWKHLLFQTSPISPDIRLFTGQFSIPQDSDLSEPLKRILSAACY